MWDADKFPGPMLLSEWDLFARSIGKSFFGLVWYVPCLSKSASATLMRGGLVSLLKHSLGEAKAATHSGNKGKAVVKFLF